jgi:hypothetical protein
VLQNLKGVVFLENPDRVAIIFGDGPVNRWTTPFLVMNLILQLEDHDLRTFKVIKNRYSYLKELALLGELFEDYTVLQDGWHGIIQLGDSDYFRLQLSAG